MQQDRTIPDVFIIESLNFGDEQARLEGEILSQILKMADKNPDYWYIRTKKELAQVLQKFGDSKKRYLHLSCHGNAQDGIKTTLDWVSFQKFAELANPHLRNRRLFISACEVTSLPLVRAIIPSSGCRSIIGPKGSVEFGDATLMWASLYHRMFKLNERSMKDSHLADVLTQTCRLFGVPMRFYRLITEQIERTVYLPDGEPARIKSYPCEKGVA